MTPDQAKLMAAAKLTIGTSDGSARLARKLMEAQAAAELENRLSLPSYRAHGDLQRECAVVLAELRRLRVENADLNAKLTIARDGLRELRESLESP